MFRPPNHAVKSAKTQESLLIEQLLECQSVRDRNSTIEPPPSRAQDSKIALGNAESPKVPYKTLHASVKHSIPTQPQLNT
jgi:hypothetical protein